MAHLGADKKFTKRWLALPLASIFIFASLISLAQQSAYAMGPPPGGCGTSDTREYDAIFTTFTISTAEQTIDVLANPGATLDADITAGYTITFTLHVQSTGLVYTPQGYERITYADSMEGGVWWSTDISRLFTQGTCEYGIAIEGEKTLTLAASYDDVGIHYDLQDTQNVNFNTSLSSASYNVRWVASTNSLETSQLTVKSEDGSGNPISGYYTVLSSDHGNVIDTGFTPVTFELDNEATYVVQVQDYGDYGFDYWKESGSTFRDQAIQITSDTVMTAVYRNVNSPPLEQQPPPDGESPSEEEPPALSKDSSVTVRSIDRSSDNEITGYYTVLFDESGNVIQTGFTPATFDLTEGQTYSVQVQDYGSYFFQYWQDDGSTDRDKTFTASDPATTFTAVYDTSQSSTEPEPDPQSDPEPEPIPTSSSSSTISVMIVDSSDNQIFGYYATLWQNGQLVQEGLSPTEFTVDGGQTYQVAVADYGSYVFDHWSDGSTDRFHDAQAGDGLIAVYYRN